MRPVFESCRSAGSVIFTCGVLWLTGCTGDLWNRISDLEQQMATMTADHRVLPQQIETLQLNVQTMDQEIRSRQGRVLTEIQHFRDEDLAHFTQRLEALTQSFQSLRKDMVSSAPWEQIHAEVADVQAAVSRMKVSLDQVQIQHQQSHSQTAKRPTTVTKPIPATDSKAASASKAP